jgi:CheY-like chemotaxis protein
MHTATVLVVDDNIEVAELIASTLASSGYQALTSESGEDALELIIRPGCAVDLVITDTYMPGGMSGLELIARILAVRPGQPILRISALSMGSLEHTEPEVPYLAKPFDSSTLLDRVAQLLRRLPGLQA